jgi:NAD(P)-dependent dehydrogenase (short-subunit alcohol dehydrogenase family)
MELTGKLALITGSTSGIGRETAALMAASGATVVVTGRNQERGEQTVKEITGNGGTARFIAADLADLDSLRHLADQAGAVDILVNNAGIFPGAPTVTQDVDSFDATLSANIRAPFFLTAALAPAMLAKGSGAIINISTMAARIGMPGLAAYSASKAALESLTRTWAAEFSPAGVRVNAVAPGPTLTDAVLANMGQEGADQMGGTTLLGRVAAAREIAEVITFLATDRAGYITGAVIAADAGRTAV